MPDTYAPTYAGRPATHSDSKNLSSRGKGKHVCHYGHNCDKGGVQPDGSLVVFERNSAFSINLSEEITWRNTRENTSVVFQGVLTRPDSQDLINSSVINRQ
ncbi:hypothetical protein LTR67_000201 [Exophiala xenobiotica]